MIPRTLVDDWMWLTGARFELTEDELFDIHLEGTQCTIGYLRDIGALVSSGKCFTLANSARLRSRFKRTQVPGCTDPIPVVCDARDLGAHLNMAMRAVGGTIAKRLTLVLHDVLNISIMPIPLEDKARLVSGKVLPASLYGCPVTPVPQGKLQKLRSRIGTLLDPKASRARSLELAFACAPKELDPAAHILAMRVGAFRRAWALSEDMHELYGDVWYMLRERGHPGCGGNINVHNSRHTEPQAYKDAKWKTEGR